MESNEVFEMKTKDEALKIAIEALDNACIKIEKWTKGGKWTAGKEALAKCKEALEQPAQEPVGWLSTGHIFTENVEQANHWVECGGLATKLYTHPAPSWQGLSDDDKANLCDKYWDSENGHSIKDIITMVEQALKEKNTCLKTT